jgi:hypothetical protein
VALTDPWQQSVEPDSRIPKGPGRLSGVIILPSVKEESSEKNVAVSGEISESKLICDQCQDHSKNDERQARYQKAIGMLGKILKHGNFSHAEAMFISSLPYIKGDRSPSVRGDWLADTRACGNLTHLDGRHTRNIIRSLP